VKDPSNLSRSGTPPPDATSTGLVQGVRRRAPDAWRRLARLYGPLVYGWCRRVGLRPVDAEEVLQEVFLTVARRIDDFRRDRPGDTFRGWLRGITRNKLGDWMRRQARQEHAVGGSEALQRLLATPAADDDELHDPEAIRALHRRALEAVRAEHEERTWQAFWRVVVEEQAPAAVAAALGLSRNAVYVARSRILRRLREVLGED
jgi:RNA polymerase sigma-70 factor (ECF subfamily)